ncbi:VOC family protein [Nocardioides marmorisolisilvae]|uniref:VOC family protein n=1 Tax=Nocardioides marmorisolisilvae TaxID=1542737 RepID=A0A3N0DPM7_9ACTN|nr:VOC family protein [Nocardioides marmorisolisilvae]RNL77608.1 VOC family protein [Nocardioides marmorisolisilvae]
MWHFSFTVSDMDRSVDFYSRVLGLELVHRQEQSNAYTAALVGFAGASLRIAQLRVPGQPRGASSHDLELVEYVEPRGMPYGGGRNCPGASHLAFAVEDAHAEYERLRAEGVQFVSPPQAITAGVNEGGFTCYFVDPDEITLELVQPPVHTSQD